MQCMKFGYERTVVSNYQKMHWLEKPKGKHHLMSKTHLLVAFEIWLCSSLKYDWTQGPATVTAQKN